jgi:hypothetical protein
LWSKATTTRILEEFGEPIFIDKSITDGPDRWAVYAKIDCHDPRLIPHVMNVHTGPIWEEVVIVVGWEMSDVPQDLIRDYRSIRTRDRVFASENQARSTLLQFGDMLKDYMRSQWGGWPGDDADDQEDDLEDMKMI